MRFVILDVEHGFAAYATAQDGSVLLFDCGYSSTTRPSDILYNQGVRTIRRLFISHYDEDHIGDLPRLRKYFTIEVLTRNKSLPVPDMLKMKTPITSAMNEMIDMCSLYTQSVSLQHPGIEATVFYNRYPDFTETNNLSLLVFLKVGDTSIALPGDLERPGWLALLRDPSVCRKLQDVDYFVASHHGRENGYCKEVFDYCTPKAVIFSDASISYDTQQMSGTYGQHASGVAFNGQHRRVLTTRKDGTLTWTI